jgi:pyrimidine-nucleoside phosphorylase
VVEAQGGDPAQIHDPGRLPQAPHRETLAAPRAGYITAIDAERVGVASVHLGAGRQRKGDPIDHAVGLLLLAKVGDWLEAGAPLVEIHARSAEQIASIHEELLGAYTWGEAAPATGPLVLGEVRR